MTETKLRCEDEPGDGAGAWTGPSDLVGLLPLELPGGPVSSAGRSRGPETPGEEPGGQSGGSQAVLHTGTEYPGLLQAGQRAITIAGSSESLTHFEWRYESINSQFIS